MVPQQRLDLGLSQMKGIHGSNPHSLRHSVVQRFSTAVISADVSS